MLVKLVWALQTDRGISDHGLCAEFVAIVTKVEANVRRIASIVGGTMK